MTRQAKFAKGDRVELQNGPAWLSGLVTFVWNAAEVDTGRRIHCYDVQGEDWSVQRVDEFLLRRVDVRRGRRQVIRAHSVRPGL